MEEIMQKWECPCGYIYDPAEGDIANGIDPDTPWGSLPEDWVVRYAAQIKMHSGNTTNN